jgi:Lipase (class 3)
MPEISNDDRILYALSVMPGMVDSDKGPDQEGQLYQQILQNLEANRQNLGSWEIAWGPGLLQFGSEGRMQNAMVVFRSVDHPARYVIAIAGTNPYSFFDWLVEDGLVAIQIPWVYGLLSAPDAKISFGTATGLAVLQTMKPTGDRPGAGTTLGELVTAIAGAALGPIEIVTVGHSLGGALSPTVALWLHETQEGWDPRRRATLSTVPTAGPTAGNGAFARLSDVQIGARTTRFANSLDVVPHAWQESDLREIEHLYTPAIHFSVLVDLFARLAEHVARKGDYTQIAPGAGWLPGTIDKSIIDEPLPVLNFLKQAAYQHTVAYTQRFGFGPGEAAAAKARLDAEVTPATMAKAIVRAGLAVPAELLHVPVVIEPRRVPIGQQWVEAPTGPDDPRLPAMVARLKQIFQTAAPGSDVAR